MTVPSNWECPGKSGSRRPESEMESAVSIKGIHKSYKEVNALQDINLEVKNGEIFGVIGPDGAGKTSLFRILATLLVANKGEINIFGLDILEDYREIRQILGYMPGQFSLYQDLSVEENINLFASLFGTTVKEQYHLIKEIYSQIEPFKNRRAGKLSGGMKQKLALSCALVHKPKLLLLDEPTTGVDPVSRKEFWGMLKRLKDWDITILVSTPYMDEATLCDRVALIQDGEILSVDTPRNIEKDYPRELFSVKSNKKRGLLKDLRNYKYTETAYPFGDEIHYSDHRPEIDMSSLRDYLEKHDHQNVSIKSTAPTIEDCFIELMK